MSLNYSHDELLRALITSILVTEEFPDVKYPKEFWNEYWNLFQKLKEEKKNLPSLDYIVETYKFEPHHTKLKQHDIINLLHEVYLKIQVHDIFTTQYKQNRGTKSAVEIIDDITREFKKARIVTESATTINVLEDREKIEAAYRRLKEQGPPIKTGITEIDDSVQFRRGELELIVGGSKGGKTTTLLKMLSQNIKDGVPASLWNLEQPLIQVQNRILAALQLANYEMLKNAKLSDEAFSILLNKINSPLFISTRQNVRGKINTEMLESHIDKVISSGIDLQCLYLDYYGLFDVNRAWDAEESFAAKLKQLAVTYNIMIVLAAQADNKTLEEEIMPKLTSVAENKGVIRDADNIIGMLGERVVDHKGLKIAFETLGCREGGYAKFAYVVDIPRGVWTPCPTDLSF